MESDSVVILIRYCRCEEGAAENILQIGAQEYFDLEPGESADCDSPPRHLELATYVGASPSELSWIEVSIRKAATGELRSVVERYWGQHASCRISVLTDVDRGNATDTETVLQITDPVSGNIHILRFGPSTQANPGGLRVHSLIRQDDEGAHVKSMIDNTKK